ncbi:hypothetical protein A2662_02265 [Candidatus Giovannonibacteria bacterium RIFCSPHIGHO2_01_FULL_45_33]|uniref:Uncharacterized protein n=1 Tax=Candidatus Giovannonibacteria bacterium RIFCSPLOWO2_01_FULL_45_34 TaxID=1798351 RepID=A0A1F5WZ71_9BACT|nr:MAG: hypothetical protein A2662_02265 [Candidatus Giovannonibacteria bacterium RIFCSPHIGHO2_01_FULL_45_33]OGF69392.1 MAG: hypothetical protein A3C73_02815 [Candidatus Giovannonibacteria bacterium RIFCSPHIGHO2_02_FULL_44_11]OGF80919.1 MAG: hypothetical protein A2930_04250 [Candidatus Giovannonibacteria bacterium RIFCSPLOWO2_01_FULL_45_34]
MKAIMNDAVKKFKEAVEKINTVYVRTGQTNDLAKILSAAILHSLFLRLGKRSSLDINNYSEKVLKLLRILFTDSVLDNNFSAPERVLIKLDTAKIPVEELNYEKDGEMLKIILKGKNILNTDGIVIEKEKEPVDMLILLDTAAEEAEKILNSTPYKDVVKITSKERGLANKTAGIISAFCPEIPKEFIEPLWVLLEEENKELAFPNAENLALCSLLGASVNKEIISQARESFFGRDFWKTLGRALGRSNFEKELQTHWTFLTRADLVKTGAGPDILISILKEIKNLTKNPKYFALLWESEADEEAPSRNISAIIGGEEKLPALASSFGLTPSSNYFFVHGFRAFSEAEIKIRAHLRGLA